MIKKLGTPLNTSGYLRGLIPDNWSEVVYEDTTGYSIRVRAKNQASSSDWERIKKNIKDEFEDNFKDIVSILPNGLDFIVYLKKAL